MGGVSGHIKHLYEDYDLTFKDIEQIFLNLCTKKIKCYEKIDGMQLSFCFVDSSDKIKFARSKTDIKNGGLTAAALLSKFEKYPTAKKAMSGASAALTKLNGPANVWHSIEVVDPENKNVILYDTRSIVSHQKELDKIFDSKKTSNGWRLVKSSELLMNVNRSNFITGYFVEHHSKVTLNEYIKTTVTLLYSSFPLGQYEILRNLIDRELTGQPTITEIKKTHLSLSNLSPEHQKLMMMKIKLHVERVKESIQLAVTLAACEALNNTQSVLIKKQTKNQRQLADRLNAALASPEVEKSESIYKHVLLLSNLSAFPSLNVEGCVFTYNNKQYKITGRFAPVNQILGIGRYNR